MNKCQLCISVFVLSIQMYGIYPSVKLIWDFTGIKSVYLLRNRDNLLRLIYKPSPVIIPLRRGNFPSIQTKLF